MEVEEGGGGENHNSAGEAVVGNVITSATATHAGFRIQPTRPSVRLSCARHHSYSHRPLVRKGGRRSYEGGAHRRSDSDADADTDTDDNDDDDGDVVAHASPATAAQMLVPRSQRVRRACAHASAHIKYKQRVTAERRHQQQHAAAAVATAAQWGGKLQGVLPACCTVFGPRQPEQRAYTRWLTICCSGRLGAWGAVHKPALILCETVQSAASCGGRG